MTTPEPGDMKWVGSGSGRSTGSSASGPSSAAIWKARIAGQITRPQRAEGPRARRRAGGDHRAPVSGRFHTGKRCVQKLTDGAKGVLMSRREMAQVKVPGAAGRL